MRVARPNELLQDVDAIAQHGWPGEGSRNPRRCHGQSAARWLALQSLGLTAHPTSLG